VEVEIKLAGVDGALNELLCITITALLMFAKMHIPVKVM